MADFWSTIFGRSQRSQQTAAIATQLKSQTSAEVRKVETRAEALIAELERARQKKKGESNE
ncbi:hypothetical protein BMG03_01115 [Thioclava nitratireducens]|uniref:Uncharacterized protein n=1 Tax=Thioclava nitratireducens TaxID=1915078 RepID=A0ABN4X8S5_9RHOB|nr:hypothetical protein [Thioclava nitratireducens]AQS46556.1 hypothetical protein BMG03_01115 [Thioclava nitratireducens]